VSPIEIVATVLGVANIVLIIRRSIWNFPVALAMVSLYAVIFAEAKLYSDAGLQVFFFAVNLYGWWAWSRNRLESGTIIVERLPLRALLVWIAGSAAAAIVWGSVMGRFTDATHPYWDASIAMLSVAAQILMTRRYLENWWWWIAVNSISIPLYLTKGLTLTAGLYGLFLILAIWGLIEWRRAEGTSDDQHLPARA
jgi:nicotinamide mononucleotide transporter